MLLLPLALWSVSSAGDAKYKIKVGDNPAPMELSDAIKKLLGKQSVQVQDASGKTLCDIWFRAEIPADATPEQIKNGVTYREVKETELLGAIRFDQDFTDYRKQKVKAGTYTLRLGYQPMDGDHQGSSEFQEFAIVLDAAKDTKPDLLDPKHMIEISQKSIGTGHPGVYMLFPVSKVGPMPTLSAMPKDHWVVNSKADVVVGGKKAGVSMGIGIAVVGSVD